MTRLILVPTQLELQRLQSIRPGWSDARELRVEICGFGPILAAARTAQLIAGLQPQRVLLMGIAGGYPDRAAVGTATCFESVACYGVGAGTAHAFLTAGEMGWPQYQSWRSDSTAPPEQGARSSAISVGDVLQLSDGVPRGVTPGGKVSRPGTSQLLTCCAAAATENDVALRLDKFPDAVAEDMEAFGVAAACLLLNTPLTVIRGISNVAGDRDVGRWQVDEALQAALRVHDAVVESA